MRRFTPAPPPSDLIPVQGNGRRLRERLPEVLDEVTGVVIDGTLTGKHTNGARVAELERRFADWLGAADVVALASGSAALRGAFELMELPPGSEVIIPAYTFVMSAYAVSDAFAVEARTGALAKGGLVPVFVDVDPETYTLDPERARAAVTERTRAIMPVHLGGQMADMAPLLALAEEHDLVVVEDAAQAHGATYRDPRTGSVALAGAAGHLGCMSLSDVKNLGTLGGDAGVLVVSHAALERFPQLGERARAWRDTGRTGLHRYRHDAWGVRARLDEYGAAECAAELPLLDAWNARRAELAERYAAALEGGPVEAPRVAPGRTHVYFNFLARAAGPGARDALIRRMRADAIGVGDAYTVVADQALYHEHRLPNRVHGTLDVARELEQLLVPIPCYPELTEPEVERIEAALEAHRPARQLADAAFHHAG